MLFLCSLAEPAASSESHANPRRKTQYTAIAYRDPVRPRVRHHHERGGPMISESAWAGSCYARAPWPSRGAEGPTQSRDARTVQPSARYRLSAHRPQAPGTGGIAGIRNIDRP